jgi:hypothetical protein
MKTCFLIYLSSIALALGAFAQTPTPSASIAPSMTPLATATAVPSATDNDENDIAKSVRQKVKRHMAHVNIDGLDHEIDTGDISDAGGIAVAIVSVVLTALFGTPVLIVAAIMLFSYLKSRSLHRTVREMVAKGQPVPPELFMTPGTRVKTRSDLRRGVILVILGVGLMVFFGALGNWESSGPWVIGLIPFFIGAAYLVLGRLEGTRNQVETRRDNTPPVP